MRMRSFFRFKANQPLTGDWTSSPFWYLLPPFTALLGLLLVLRIWQIDLRVPLNFSGDALAQLLYAQAWCDGESWSHITRLGYPLGHNVFLFPQNAHVDLTVLGCLAMLTGVPSLALNLTYFLQIMLTALTASWSLRRLGIGPSIAFVISVLYALTPYGYYRHVNHLTLSFYSVPIILLLCIKLMQNEWDGLGRGAHALIWIVLIVVGLNSPYMAFFSLICLAWTAIVCAMARFGKCRNIAVISIAVLIGISILNSIPGIKALNASPAAAAYVASQRRPASSTKFALHISDLLLPIQSHPIQSLGKLTARFGEAYPDRTGETRYSALGMLGSIGFLLQLLLMGTCMVSRRTCRPLLGQVAPAASLTLILVLYAVPGGFMTFANMIAPLFRAQARVSIFIAFLALFTMAKLFQAQRDRLLKQGVSVWIPRCAACLLLVVGVIDQAVLHQYAPIWNGHKQDKANLTAFLREIRTRFGGNLKLYGVPFPERPSQYNLLKPYFVSPDSTVSFAPENADVRAWNERLATNILGERLSIVRLLGFDGVWLDESESTPSEVGSLPSDLVGLGLTELIAPGGRYRYYPLLGFDSPALQRYLAEPEYYRSLLRKVPLVPLHAGQILTRQGSPELAPHLESFWSMGTTPYAWSLSNGTQMATVLLPLEKAEGRLRLVIRSGAYVPAGGKPQRIELYLNGSPVHSWKAANQKPLMQSFLVPEEARATGLLELGFRTPDAIAPASVSSSSDRRTLGVSLYSIALEAELAQ